MDLFFELIQVALGSRDKLSRVPNDKDWENLYDEADRQAVLGVALDGIDRLPYDQRPSQELLLQWIGVMEMVKQRNQILNQRVSELQKSFSEAGFRSCLLKGQGNARMYPNPLSRMPGDIDLWIDGKRKEINSFVLSKAQDAHKGYKDISFKYKDTDVEAHYFPTYLNNFVQNRKLQHYIEEHKEEQFSHDGEIGARPDSFNVILPSDTFNVVLQMAHLYHHFFCEGIGLRHFIDFFYLLRREEVIRLKEEQDCCFNEFGMMRFARGVMWVEKEILGIEDGCLLVVPDEKVGRLILKEIKAFGNFNNADTTGKSVFYGKLSNTFRPFKYLFSFPAASIDRLLFNGWLQIRKLKTCICK